MFLVTIRADDEEGVTRVRKLDADKLVVVNADLTHFASRVRVPNKDRRKTVQWSTPTEGEDQVFIRGHLHTVNDVIQLILQHLCLRLG